MKIPKIIPEKIFKIIGGVLCTVYLVLLISWVINFSGPYAFMATSILDTDGTYDVMMALGLTILVTALPLLGLALILRLFSNIKPLRKEFSDLPHAFKSQIFAHTLDIPPLRKKRILAFLIDRSLAVLLIALTAAPAVVLREEFPQLKILFIVIAVFFAVTGIFYAWARDFKNGQSLGRRFLKIKVVDVETEKPIGAGKSFIRELSLHVAPLALIETLFLFINKDGRRLGDKWAKTKVVEA